MNKSEALKLVALIHAEYEQLKQNRKERFFEEGKDKYQDGQIAGEMCGLDKARRIICKASNISHAEYMDAVRH